MSEKKDFLPTTNKTGLSIKIGNKEETMSFIKELFFVVPTLQFSMFASI